MTDDQLRVEKREKLHWMSEYAKVAKENEDLREEIDRLARVKTFGKQRTAPPDDFLHQRIVGKAGFSDGYGAWVGIVADPSCGLVRVMTRQPDGKRESVAFLPHERTKVLNAFTEAFDEIAKDRDR